MAQLAIDDETGSELDQAEIVGGPLLPAGEQPPEMCLRRDARTQPTVTTVIFMV